jgi:exonuclease SbcC
MIAENLQLMGFDFEPFFQTESETGKEIFQFGWVNEKGHFVNFDAMSTGQQTVFLAAMMMTIIDRAKPKLRLLVMDNLNHLDRTNFQLLINGLNKLAHKVDNIILAGAIEFPFEAEGWNVCDVTPGKEESLRE